MVAGRYGISLRVFNSIAHARPCIIVLFSIYLLFEFEDGIYLGLREGGEILNRDCLSNFHK